MFAKVKVPWSQRYRTSRAIFGQSMKMLGGQRDLWWFPLLAVLVMLPVMAASGWGAWMLTSSFGVSPVWVAPLAFLVLLPVTYPLSIFTTMLTAAFVYTLWMRMEGEACTVRDGWSAAKRQWRTIAKFTAITMLVVGLFQVVGVLLDRLNLIPYVRQATMVVGQFAWAAAAFFVIPVIVVERETGAIAALKESVRIGRHQWGKAVAGMLTIALAVMVPMMLFAVGWSLLMPAMFLVAPGAPFALVLALFLVPFLVMFTVMMALSMGANAAYQTALYRYARTNEITAPFTTATLVDAWAPYRSE